MLTWTLPCLSPQEEHEIPASVFAKEPVSSPNEGKEDLADENKSLEETLHTVDLSSEDELAHDEEALGDSAEESMGESRAEKIKRSSLRKVDSLKKAFSRQNIEKQMNRLGTKIVSVERREKIKKSFASNHQKTSSGKSSPFKVSPLTFGRKKIREGESAGENETKSEDAPSNEHVPNDHDHEGSSLAEGLSQASLSSVLAEGKGAEGESGRAASRGSNSGMDSNVDLTVEEDEESLVAREQAQKVRYEAGYALNSKEAERSEEEAAQPPVLQVGQMAWAGGPLGPAVPAGRREPRTRVHAPPALPTHHCVVAHAAAHTWPRFAMKAACQGSISNLPLGPVSVGFLQDCQKIWSRCKTLIRLA